MYMIKQLPGDPKKLVSLSLCLPKDTEADLAGNVL
jgi:hypothetical protein